MVMVDAQTVRGGRYGSARSTVALDIKAPPAGFSGFVPIRPLYRIEHAFAQLGRWWRLSRRDEGTDLRASLARGRLVRLPRLARGRLTPVRRPVAAPPAGRVLADVRPAPNR